MPLCNLRKKYFTDLENVINYSEWKKTTKAEWESIVIEQEETENANNSKLVAGSKIKVRCLVTLGNIKEENACVQVYFGQFMENRKC